MTLLERQQSVVPNVVALIMARTLAIYIQRVKSNCRRVALLINYGKIANSNQIAINEQ
jgi:hypothetical protein